MVRAGGVPRARAFGAIKSIIASRTSATTITRPTKSTGSMGQQEETTATDTEDLWLFTPDQAVGEVAAGERIAGDMMALGLDGIDVQKDDRITHGGVEYEVDTVIGRPSDADADGTTHGDTEYFAISLVRRST